MEEQIKKLEVREDGFLEVTLKKVKDFDEYVFALLNKDAHCLSCIRDHKSKLKFYYDTKGYLDLLAYLHAHRFEKKEGLDFLIYLFEHLVGTNTNKPVYLQSNYIFLSYDGGILKFLVLPLTMDKWVFQSEQSMLFIKELIENLKIENGYEIIGFLVEELIQKTVSLPNILQGLHHFKTQQQEKKPWYAQFFKSKEEVFTVRDLPVPKREIIQPIPEEEVLMETMMLFSMAEETAFLAIANKQLYPIRKQTFTIGRDHDNDLMIADSFISGKHAIYQKETGILQDLNSSNGTFVNQERITTKKLKDGDLVSFAACEYEFRQPERRAEA